MKTAMKLTAVVTFVATATASAAAVSSSARGGLRVSATSERQSHPHPPVIPYVEAPPRDYKGHIRDHEPYDQADHHITRAEWEIDNVLPRELTVRNGNAPHHEPQHHAPQHAPQHHAPEHAPEHASHLEGEAEGDEGPNRNLPVAWMLMGSVCFAMILFYLVNAKQKRIQEGTWKALNMTISIFAAVLLYTHIHHAIMHFFHLGHGSFLANFVLFLFFYVLANVLLLIVKDKGSETDMVAVGQLMAHLAAFAAMYAFAALQETPWIKENVFFVALVVPIAVACILGLELVGEKVRDYVSMWDGVADESEKLYEEKIEEAENDMMAICTGFLMMQTLRYIITGKLQPFHPADPPSPDITRGHHLWLLACAFISAFGTFYATKMVNKHMAKGQEVEKHTLRYASAMQIIFSMCMAWCFLFWGEWVVYSDYGFKGPRMWGVLFVAVLLTALCIVGIFVIDYIKEQLREGKGRRSMRNVQLALGFIVGLAWEKCFDVALEHINESMAEFGDERLSMGLLLCATMSVVLPAWRLYILPKTMGKETP